MSWAAPANWNHHPPSKFTYNFQLKKEPHIKSLVLLATYRCTIPYTTIKFSFFFLQTNRLSSSEIVKWKLHVCTRTYQPLKKFNQQIMLSSKYHSFKMIRHRYHSQLHWNPNGPNHDITSKITTNPNHQIATKPI